MEIESWESELLGKPVEAAMERNLWFAGTLVEIIDLFVPYRVKMDGTGEVRGFLRIRKPTANIGGEGRPASGRTAPPLGSFQNREEN
jgi:hypothetical protein